MKKTTHKSKWIFALLVTAAMMSSTTATADELYLELHGNSSAVDGTQQRLANNSTVSGPGFYLGIEPDWLAGGRLMLGYDGDGFEDTRHFDNDLFSTWSRDRAMAKADFGYDLVEDQLRPLIRTGVGYSYQRLELTDTDNTTYRGSDHGVSAMVAGGLETRIALGGDEDSPGRFSLGANLLLGYSWNSRANFDEMESTETQEDDSWQRSSYDAGSMRTAGFAYSAGVTLRYRFGN